MVYAIILVGGFVRAMGRDYTVTLEHYLTGFRIEQTARGLFFSGSAWDSFSATLKVAALAAPLTAAVGLLTAYLLTRQNFSGRRAFEFGTMLSFAIPGTVVGVSYILAFNVPPIEITGTAFVLVMCFVFRNMPVAVRSGIATLAQIDRSLDEASLTLGARSFATVRRVILPLLRPAVVASLVYSFVRAMTAVSAVIFLVTAEYNMATTYIVGRVEAGEFGLAIAYSSVLIAVMLVAILLIQLAVGERRLGRRDATQSRRPAPSPPRRRASGLEPWRVLYTGAPNLLMLRCDLGLDPGEPRSTQRRRALHRQGCVLRGSLRSHLRMRAWEGGQEWTLLYTSASNLLMLRCEAEGRASKHAPQSGAASAGLRPSRLAFARTSG